MGCSRVKKLVEDVREGRPLGEKELSHREVHTDEFGRLERNESEAFNSFMLTSVGKPDRVPIELTSVHVLGGKGELDQLEILPLNAA